MRCCRQRHRRWRLQPSSCALYHCHWRLLRQRSLFDLVVDGLWHWSYVASADGATRDPSAQNIVYTPDTQMASLWCAIVRVASSARVARTIDRMWCKHVVEACPSWVEETGHWKCHLQLLFQSLHALCIINQLSHSSNGCVVGIPTIRLICSCRSLYI